MATSSASACLGSRATQAAFAEFRDVVRHQREAGAGTGREIARATRAVLAADAFEPREKITHEICRFLQALPAVFQAGMHVHAQRRLPAAERTGLVVLNRLIGCLHHARGRDAEAV